MTGEEDHRHTERAQLLGLEFVFKPPPTANLLAFVERCLGRVDPVAHFARRYGLSPRETEMVRHLFRGKALKQLPEVMSVAPATIHSFRSRILRKTRRASAADVVRAVFEEQSSRT